MKIQQIADDLTGRILTEDTTELAITIEGKKITLDLSEESAEAIKALGTKAAPELFAAIFGGSRSAVAGTGDAAKVRDWYKGLDDDTKSKITPKGYEAERPGELKDKGTIPGWALTAYQNA